MKAVFYREYYGKKPPLRWNGFRLEQLLAETGGRRAVYACDGKPIFGLIVAWGLMTAVDPDSAGECDQIVLALVVGDGDGLTPAAEVSNFVGVAEAGESADDWLERCQIETASKAALLERETRPGGAR